MNESKISVRYAKALLSLANEQNVSAEIRDNVETLNELINTTPELKDFLENPVLRPSYKLDILIKSFKTIFNPIMLSFLKLVIKNKRELYLSSILRAFTDLFKKDNRIKSVVLTTAKPASKKTIKTIKDYITREFDFNIELSEKVDDKLIGGFILRMEDHQINASVENHLNNIKKELLSI